MSQESNQPTQLTDYPANLFDESRDHANQWDVSALWGNQPPPARADSDARAAASRARQSRDHANQWDIRALLPERQ